MNPQLASIDQIKDTVLDLAIRFGPKLLVAILILAVGFAVSRLVSRWFLRGLNHVELEPPVRALLARVAWALTLSLFAILALQNLGVELLPLIAGEEGVVTAITLFNTTLTHEDHSRVVIPNRKIVGDILHNSGNMRQLNIAVGVAYDSDITAAVAAINEVLSANPRVLKDPPPVVRPIKLGDWSVNIGVRPWVLVPDYGAASGEINGAILERFRDRGIVMPVPQREVRLIGNARAGLE
jgi:small conductance mechanosensitive channel